MDTPPGTVFIDGHDVLAYPLAQLRSEVAMVPQDPFLFGEPVKDNITYDEPARTVDLVWQAAESADLKRTIEEFPERMDTIVGERGVTLSGGQKQRTTLARGLIRNAPVLVLDDCFSSVDTETEEHILTELGRLREGQTTVLVSHRVSTARHSDRIVVLEERPHRRDRHARRAARARRTVRRARTNSARRRRSRQTTPRRERRREHACRRVPPKDRKRRDYSMFDAELSGQVLNLELVGRLLAVDASVPGDVRLRP